MVKTSEIAKGLMKNYAEEAFLNHRKQVYSAIKAICFCTEFLQNQEDWGSRRALTLRQIYTGDDYWEEEFEAGYDSGLRREEFEKLREALKTPGFWTAEEIPLKNFLNQGIVLMMEYTRQMELWMELMEAQIITDQYTDYRAVQEAVYVLGLFELMKFQNGISCHYFKGDFREAERLLKEIRNWIPTEEQENYDSYSMKLLQEMEQRRIDTMKQVLKERDERLEKVKDGIPVLNLFCRKMKEMGDDEFGEFIRNRISECGAFEEEEKWDSQMNLKAKVVCRVWKLAELFIYGGSFLKERLFQNLSEEEQIAVMELWMAGFYPFYVEKLADRIEAMTDVVEPGYPVPDACYKQYTALSWKNMRDSLQTIMENGFVKERYFGRWMCYEETDG